MKCKQKKRKIIIEKIGGKIYATIAGVGSIYLPAEIIVQAMALIEQQEARGRRFAIDENKFSKIDESKFTEVVISPRHFKGE